MAGLLTIALSGCAGDDTGTTQTQNQNQNTAPSTQAASTYKIGVVTPLTGDAAPLGQEERKLLEYRLAEINKENEASGNKFELSFEDGKCDGSSAVTAFQKLTDVDNVHFIIGGSCSSETLGIAPLLVDKKAVAVSPTSSNPDIEGKSPNLFTLSYSDATVGEGIADQLGKFKKVALLSEQNDFNEGLKKTVEKNLKAKYPDTKIVANEEFPKGSTDFRNQLDKLKASKADAVFLNPNVGVTAQGLLKQIAEIKNWKTQFISQFAYISSEVLKVAPKAAESMIVIDAPGVTDSKFVDYKNKAIAAIGSLDNLGSYYSASTLDTLNILSSLVAQNKGDADAVQKALAGQTFTGYISNKIMFGGKSFVQGVGAVKFMVKDGKAEMADAKAATMKK